MTAKRPGWLVVGAEVVVWKEGRGGKPETINVTRVARIAAKSFTVEDDSHRFNVETLAEKTTTGTGSWSRTVTYRVSGIQTEEGQAKVRTLRRLVAQRRVDDAHEAWNRTHSPLEGVALREAVTRWLALAEES